MWPTTHGNISHIKRWQQLEPNVHIPNTLETIATTHTKQFKRQNAVANLMQWTHSTSNTTCLSIWNPSMRVRDKGPTNTTNRKAGRHMQECLVASPRTEASFKWKNLKWKKQKLDCHNSNRRSWICIHLPLTITLLLRSRCPTQISLLIPQPQPLRVPNIFSGISCLNEHLVTSSILVHLDAKPLWWVWFIVKLFHCEQMSRKQERLELQLNIWAAHWR